MTRTPKDIPHFPDYITGQTDHEFMQAAWDQGPLARDKIGIVSGFSMAQMALFNDDRWTRQVELEAMWAAGVTDGPMFEFVRDMVLFSNGQTHRNRRAPLVRTFAHKVIADLRPEIASRAETMISGLRGSGIVDFAGSIAGPLPAQVIAAIVGAPEQDTAQFATHVYSAIRGLSIGSEDVRVESDADMRHLDRYVADLIDNRRKSPKPDFLTAYLDRVKGGPLDENEVRVQMIGLVVAGSDTTRGALTATVSQLMQHRDQWDMLVEDPEKWAPAAVSEGLRFDPVIGSLARISQEPREVEGIMLPKGTFVAASMLTAMRDPAVYSNPNQFDITRSDHPRLHPIFGGGPHRCLGEALARIELEETLKALVRLVPDLALEGAPVKLRGYGAVRTLGPMQVRL